MSGCQCKSGFFALRDCGQPVVTQCLTCQRTVCLEHASRESNLTLCLDCFTRSDQNAAHPNTNANQYDDQWAYGYRQRYYGAGYAPIYSGDHYHHYYDRYDARSFDQGGSGGDFADDDPRAGFGDS